MKIYLILLLITIISGCTNVNVNNDRGLATDNSTPPQLWSDHKNLNISVRACALKGYSALTSLEFTNVVQNGNYSYGIFNNNRAAVKCVEMNGGSFVYLAVAGPYKKVVEKLRNEIARKFQSHSARRIKSESGLSAIEKKQRNLVSSFYEVLEMLPKRCPQSSRKEYLASVKRFEESFPEFISLIKKSKYRSYAIKNFSTVTPIPVQACLYIKKELDKQVVTEKGQKQMRKNLAVMRIDS